MEEFIYQFSADQIDKFQKVNELRFRKELIYEASFDKDGQKFSVDTLDFDHWISVHQQMIADGIKIPVCIEHTRDPEATRGFLLSLERGLDSLGREALFGIIEFKTTEYAKLAATSDVSIYCPRSRKRTTQEGGQYYRPIEHVALTNYPVVGGLDEFEGVLACSVIPEMELSMNEHLKQLAEMLGIQIADDMTDEQITAEIGKVVKSLQDAMKPKPKPEEKPEGGQSTTPTPTPTPAPISAGLLSMARENRDRKLDDLARDGKITKKVADSLKKQFCTDDALALSLSTQSDDSSDQFDSVIASLSMNESFVKPEATSSQGLRKDEDNPMIKEAKKLT